MAVEDVLDENENLYTPYLYSAAINERDQIDESDEDKQFGRWKPNLSLYGQNGFVRQKDKRQSTRSISHGPVIILGMFWIENEKCSIQFIAFS